MSVINVCPVFILVRFLLKDLTSINIMLVISLWHLILMQIYRKLRQGMIDGVIGDPKLQSKFPINLSLFKSNVEVKNTFRKTFR